MGRKKNSERPAGSKSFRFNADDFAEIDQLATEVGASLDSKANESRAIRYAVRFTNAKGIKVAGEVGGGRERWREFDESERLPVAAVFVENSVTYRVRGNSMIDRNIVDGDYVLVRRNPSPPHGAIVVAWIRGTGGVVKTFDANKNELHSGKGKDRWAYSLTDDDKIFGVYVGLVRTAKVQGMT